MSYAHQLPSLLYYPLALDAGDNGVHWVELSEVYMPPHHPNPDSSHAPNNATGVVRRRNDR